MRYLALACLAPCLLASTAAAQPKQQLPPLRVKIEKVRLGFQGSGRQGVASTFKPGLWAPVHVTLLRAPDGTILLPRERDNTVAPAVRVESTDSDDIPNAFTRRFPRLGTEKVERLHLLTYTKPAVKDPSLRVVVSGGGTESGAANPEPFFALDLNEQLYLSLGAQLPNLHQALVEMAGNQEDKSTNPRHLAHETEVHRLPTRWYGYSAVDLLILTGDNKTFLENLLRTENKDRREALAGWVRRGGRLVVSVAWANQELMHRLLTDRDAWSPLLPEVLVLPAGRQPYLKGFHRVQSWAQIGAKKALLRIGDDPLRVALLQNHPAAETEVREEALIKRSVGGKAVEEGLEMPVMVRAPYGRGSVTLLAFDVAQGPFTAWKGAPDFWKAALGRFAPRMIAQKELAFGGPRDEGAGSSDVTSRLHQQLDLFDSPPISFGWVALFILLYIVVVGPFDYLLLKKVFKRLELTWITFPAVVLTISLAAYFTAYAVKGTELKVNKIDLIDLDLRTDLTEDGRPRSAHAYGTTWFTILSPRIQSYTIGIEPVFPRLADGGPAEETPRAMTTWLGRPEAGGIGAVGRQRSQSLFVRTYQYQPAAEGRQDPAGLKDVPIQVWTTKSFTATWDAPLKKLPFEATLQYDPEDDRKLIGSIKNNLPFRLEDVVLIYGDRWYREVGDFAPGDSWKVESEKLVDNFTTWSRAEPIHDREAMLASGFYDPGSVLKELLFQEKADQGRSRNHSQRMLDLSWRLDDWRSRNVEVREVILVARLGRARGQAQALADADDPKLPTHLWLGAIPGGDQPRPDPGAHLVQDTYIRVILPVTRKR